MTVRGPPVDYYDIRQLDGATMMWLHYTPCLFVQSNILPCTRAVELRKTEANEERQCLEILKNFRK
jgi:hypothetical protein